MSGPTKTDAQRRSSLAVWIIVGSCILFGYVLSIGPVVGLAARGYLGSNPYPSIRLVYKPLLYINDHNQGAADVMDWWEAQFGPIEPARLASPLTVRSATCGLR